MSHSRLMAAIAASLLCAATMDGQSVYSQSVSPASFDQAAPRTSAAGEKVTFGRRAPQIGDQLEQHLDVTLKLNTIVRQQQEVVEKSKTAIHRKQHRIVTTSQIQDGVPIEVVVRYVAAAKEIANGTAEGKLGEFRTAPQPVNGKSYHVRREGESLIIADGNGSVPPLDEYEIVALNMDSLGRPNPLADFLAGKTVAVGEQITLPNQVAEKLMGLGGEMGEVTQFELTLQKVTTINGQRCAVFQSAIEAASTDSSQMRLMVEGPLAIEVDTCRAADATFVGPIGMSETRGSLSATYQMSGTGKMLIHIASKYRDLQR